MIVPLAMAPPAHIVTSALVPAAFGGHGAHYYIGANHRLRHAWINGIKVLRVDYR
ncbi:hypothetical protein [Nocardioides caldifontis]|uniref:hypothetical protein n=1 Tax=Nocardioides caldifontis TaxID=2588938 RepID=UPI001396939E|nr:hypothetical protein [Nocardioides caldifontis]